jgi:heat shock protein HslJ
MLRRPKGAGTTNARFSAFLYAVALLVIFAAAGAEDTSALPLAAAVAESPQPATAAGDSETKQRNEAPGNELAGTSWRLVKIMSIDDHVYEPVDASKFTLDSGADGTATMLADCNRGTDTWTSASAGQVRFDPIAATNALCPPGARSSAP